MDSEHIIKINSNGSVSLTFYNVLITSWCPNPLENWPNEHLDCDIILGLDQGPLDSLPLVYKGKWKHPKIDSLSEWTLHEIGVRTVASGMQTRFTDKQILQAMDGDIVVEFDISRNNHFYRNVFSMPILGKYCIV